MTGLIKILTLVFALSLPANSLQTSSSYCTVDRSANIDCHQVGADGRPLDTLMRASTDKHSGGNVNFNNIASTMEKIYVKAANKSNAAVKISPNGLAQLTNLYHLSFDQERYEGEKGKADLVIDKNAFQHTPRVKSLRIYDYNLVPDTIHAIGELKNRLEELHLIRVTPVEEAILLAKKFTNLKELRLGALNIGTLPQRAWQGSAIKLTELRLTAINLRTITTATFRGMSNLKNLELHEINITSIEPGAFDDLVNLEDFKLENNHRMMTTLPNGLFSKTKKIETVDMYSSGITNLSRANFTHCPNFNLLTT